MIILVSIHFIFCTRVWYKVNDKWRSKGKLKNHIFFRMGARQSLMRANGVRQADKQSGRQAGKKADMQADKRRRQADNQTEIVCAAMRVIVSEQNMQASERMVCLCISLPI